MQQCSKLKRLVPVYAIIQFNRGKILAINTVFIDKKWKLFNNIFIIIFSTAYMKTYRRAFSSHTTE